MNAIDYLRWRGDIRLRTDPFNLVDNVLLSKLAYVHFEGVLEERMTLKDARDRYEEVNGTVPEILEELAKSERFHNAELHHYVSKTEKEGTMQFAALMIDLDDWTTYVSFRGTDGTIVGWKEDFMMLYRVVQAQEEAVDYLNRYGRHIRKLRVGGHSKGGILALYASMKADPEVQKRITAIFSNDGPGLGPGVYEEEAFNKVKARYIKIVPEMDVFGLAFDHESKKVIVSSTKNSVLAHDMMTWKVERNRFLTASGIRNDSVLLGQAFESFLTDTTFEQRELFTKEFFRVLEESGIEKTSQLFSPSLTGVMPIVTALRKLADLDPDTKEVVGRFIKVFTSPIESGINDFLEKVNLFRQGSDDKANDTKENSDKDLQSDKE